MEEKKLVPKKRFSEHKHDGAWSHLNWKDTVDISINMVDPRNDEFSDLPHIGPGNIKSFTGLLLNNINTVKEDNLISGKFHFNVGDIIYGKINPQLGKYTYALYEGLASADTYILNAKNELEQGFLFVLLQTKHFFNYSVSVSKRSGMPKINRDELNEYTFCAPNKQEQQKIGAFFKVLDERIANQERKIAKVKALKAAYLTEMFPQEGETVPKRRFKGFEDDWRQFELAKLTDLYVGKSFTSSIESNGKYIVMDMGSVSQEGNRLIHKKTNLKRNILLKEDLVMPKDDIGGGHIIGKTAYINQNNRYVLGDHVYGLRFQNNYGLFMHYCINSKPINKNIRRKATGSAQLGIGGVNVLNTIVVLPSLEEQQKIGEFFKNLDNQIETEEKKLYKLQKMKEAYLEEMFV